MGSVRGRGGLCARLLLLTGRCLRETGRYGAPVESSRSRVAHDASRLVSSALLGGMLCGTGNVNRCPSPKKKRQRQPLPPGLGSARVWL